MDDTTITLARTGRKAPVSGRYEELAPDGNGVGAFCHLTVGQLVPSGSNGPSQFRLIDPDHGSATSAVLDEGMRLFEPALRNLVHR